MWERLAEHELFAADIAKQQDFNRNFAPAPEKILGINLKICTKTGRILRRWPDFVELFTSRPISSESKELLSTEGYLKFSNLSWLKKPSHLILVFLKFYSPFKSRMERELVLDILAVDISKISEVLTFHRSISQQVFSIVFRCLIKSADSMFHINSESIL